MATDPCSAGFLSQLLHGNAIVCNDTFKQFLSTSAQNQIQSVADNAASEYGSDSVAAQAAQASANVQKSYAGADTNSITNDISNSDVGSPFLNSNCDGLDFSSIGLGCLTKWMIAGIVAVILLVILGPYILPYVFPRRR